MLLSKHKANVILQLMVTYTRVGLCETLEYCDMEVDNSWSSCFLGVLVKPQVVTSVRAQVVLLSV
jgi:hypothetical protein